MTAPLEHTITGTDSLTAIRDRNGPKGVAEISGVEPAAFERRSPPFDVRYFPELGQIPEFDGFPPEPLSGAMRSLLDAAPMIFRGAAPRVREVLSRDSIVRLLGHRDVPVLDATGEQRLVSGSDLGTLLDRGAAYLSDYFLFEAFPELLERLRSRLPPSFYDDYFACFPGKAIVANNPWVNVYWGAPFTATRAHYNQFAGNTWHVLAEGRKQWLMFSGRELARDYLTQLATSGLLDKGWITCDTLRRYLDSLSADSPVQKILTAELEAGDVLHIPWSWVHQVHNLEQSLALTRVYLHDSNLAAFFDLVNSHSGAVGLSVTKLFVGGRLRRMGWRHRAGQALGRKLEGGLTSIRHHLVARAKFSDSSRR